MRNNSDTLRIKSQIPFRLLGLNERYNKYIYRFYFQILQPLLIQTDLPPATILLKESTIIAKGL